MTTPDRRLSLDQWRNLRFSPPAAAPLIEPTLPATRVSHPAVLGPDQSPDRQWHLWAHSQLGIDHYTAPDGLRWQRRELVAAGVEEASVRRVGEGFVLAYARPRLGALDLGAQSRSDLALRRSDNLLDWAPASQALVPGLPWHREAGFGRRLGSPQLVPHGGRYRLVYTAGAVAAPGTGARLARYVGMAEGDDLGLSFVAHPQPMVQPTAEDTWANLAVGPTRVFEALDGWVALSVAHALTREATLASAVRLLISDDGVSFSPSPWPLFVADGSPWRDGRLGGIDAVVVADALHLYFSVEGRARLVRETIGRVSAQLPG